MLSDDEDPKPVLINHIKRDFFNSFTLLPNSIYRFPFIWIVQNKTVMYLTNDNE